MSLPPVAHLIATAWWALAIAVLVATASLALVQRRIGAGRLPPPGAPLPPLSVIMPVKGREPALPQALEAVLRQLRPGDEVIVACAEPDGPSLPLARQTLARYPDRAARISIGAVAETSSPKMNTMIGPMRDAANDMVLTLDANAVLAQGGLALLQRHMAPGVGLVTVVTQATAPRGGAAGVETAFMNAYQARMLLAASTLGLGFGLGKAMLFDRAAFARAGGVPAIAGLLNEDHAMSLVFARAGLRTVIATQEVSQPLGPRGLGAVWHRQLRWMICRRVSEPVAFLAEPLFTAATATLLALAAGPVVGLPGPALALLTLIGWHGVETLFLRLKGWQPAGPAGFLGRELLLPALWLRAWTTSGVIWAGTRLDARHGAGNQNDGSQSDGSGGARA